jgi:FkbM family methyltransferase
MPLPRTVRNASAALLRALPVKGRWRVAPLLNALFPVEPVLARLPDVGRVLLDLGDEDQLQVFWTGLHRDDARIVRLARAVLPPDGVSLDVGANVGLHTLAAARHLQAGGGRVLSFEPHPVNYRTLLGNIERNGLGRVTAENFGLADAPAVVPGRGPARGGNWSLASDGEHVFDVRLLRLDDYLADCPVPRLDLVKLDVEGAEVRVLRGAARTLARLVAGRRPCSAGSTPARKTAEAGGLCRCVASQASNSRCAASAVGPTATARQPDRAGLTQAT